MFRVIKDSIVIIDKTFKGQLVVPHFDDFTQDISDIYARLHLFFCTCLVVAGVC